MSRESLTVIRVALGLAQGAALYLLYDAFEAKSWLPTEGLLFASLVLTAVFVPTLAVAGLGNLRLRTFAIWIGAAIVLVAALGAYDIFHDPVGAGTSSPPRNLPSAPLWLAAAAGLFIAHALVVSGDADRAYIAKYPRYFDVAWKHAVQAVLAVAFVGALWAVLALGAALFELIKINFLADLLSKRWFSIPVSTLAFILGIHLTDVHAAVVRGVRTLKLTLLSWLLPLITLITVGFLVALLFTGLDPLWSTHRATSLVLLTAAALILLLNAAYQDGEGEHRVAGVLRYVGIGAALALTPLVVIAAYGVMLRVGQYGWTPERIVATACVVVAACYAVGYGIAVAARPWLRWIEATNVIAAIVILAVILSLFSPIADPIRIAVADQVARLEAGRTPVDQFDFAFLRFRGGRYGLEALGRLRDSPGEPGTEDARIAGWAISALSWAVPGDARRPANGATPASRAADITVAYPNGQSLPPAFLQQDWNALPDQWGHPLCLTTNKKCDAVMLDVDGDGTSEILVSMRPNSVFVVYGETDGKWVRLGILANSNCKGARAALLAGHFEFAVPEFKEIKVADGSLYVERACQ